jgi:hypothetical protein
MSLDIKDEESGRLAREPAQGNGETAATADTIAANERPEPQGEPSRRKSRLEALMRFAELCAPYFKDGPSGNEIINDLYDEETGLPK